MYPAVEHFFAQHTDINQRLDAAAVLAGEMNRISPTTTTNIPLYVDTMANTASIQFGALPERLVILLDGKVHWIGGKGPMEYSLPKAEAALQEVLQQ
jgi:hypothetical protein